MMKKSTVLFLILLAFSLLSLAMLDTAEAVPQKIRGEMIKSTPGELDTSHINPTSLPAVGLRYTAIFSLMENDSQVRQASISDTSTRSYTADSSEVVGQLPYLFNLTYGTAFSTGDLVIDTTNGALLYRDFSPDAFYWPDSTWVGTRITNFGNNIKIDSAAYADVAGQATLADSCTEGVKQLPYGFVMRYGTGTTGKYLYLDSTNMVMKFNNAAGQTGIFEDTTWVGDRVDAASLANPYWYSTRLMSVHANAAESTVTEVGMPTCTLFTTGTKPNGDGSDGQFIRFITGGTSGDSAGICSGTATKLSRVTRTDWNPEFVCRIKTPATVTNYRLWIGLFSTQASSTADPAGHIAAFYVNAGATAGTWYRAVKDGSTLATNASAIVCAANSVYRLRIACTATTADFYINDTHIGQSTGNLPDSATDLGFHVYVTTTTAAARELYWDYVTISQK